MKRCRVCGATIPPNTPHTEERRREYRWAYGNVTVYEYLCQVCSQARFARAKEKAS